MIPRIRIAHLPTPVEPMSRLSAVFGGQKLLVKRDDLTGPAFGGNKIRKLEFVLAEAQANGARTVITVGAAQSNHCRQTAALAARLGLQCILVLSGDPNLLASGNLLLDRLFSARIVWTEREGRDEKLQQVFEESWAAGERPYLIPLGASDPVGTLGYVFAFRELMEQQVNPDWIVIASSSAGTQAGLVLGAKQADWQGKILGVSVDQPQNLLKQRIAALAEEASERFGKRLTVSPEEVLVNDDYLGGGYGVLGESEIEAIQLFAEYEGLLLDPVYTGRAAAALIDLMRKGYFKDADKILFWHTGGTPSLFSDMYSPHLAAAKVSQK